MRSSVAKMSVIAVMFIFAASMLSVGAVAPGHPAYPWKWVPPYPSTSGWVSDVFSGEGSYSYWNPAEALSTNYKTGHVEAAAGASCGPSSSAWYTVLAGFGINDRIRFTAPSTGTITAYFGWSVNYRIQLTVETPIDPEPDYCTECTGLVYVYASVRDCTSGSIIGSDQIDIAAKTITSGTYFLRAVANDQYGLQVPCSVIAGHVYSLKTYVIGDAKCVGSSTDGCVALAGLEWFDPNHPLDPTGATVNQIYWVATAANVPPTAAFSATTSGLTVNVDGRASSDSDGTIFAYAWNWGDGSTGSGSTASHTYAAHGTYTIQLTVTDDDGATGTTTKSVALLNQPPNADFLFSSVSGLAVTADGSWSSDPDGTVSTYAWTWGDGTSTPASSLKTASHTYATAGTYTVQLTVKDNDGASATDSLGVTVPPAVMYTLTIATPPGCPTPKAGTMSVPAGSDVTVYACGGYSYGKYTYVFSRWKLDTTDWYSTASSVVVHMDKAHTITAVFDRYLY